MPYSSGSKGEKTRKNKQGQKSHKQNVFYQTFGLFFILIFFNTTDKGPNKFPFSTQLWSFLLPRLFLNPFYIYICSPASIFHAVLVIIKPAESKAALLLLTEILCDCVTPAHVLNHFWPSPGVIHTMFLLQSHTQAGFWFKYNETV